jgi:cyclomaltodextrinase
MTDRKGRGAARLVPLPVLGVTLLLAAVAPARDGVFDRAAFRHDADGPDQLVWAAAESPDVRFLFLRFAHAPGDAIRAAGVRLYRIDDKGFEGFRDLPAEPYARDDSLEYRAVTWPFEDDPRAQAGRTRWRGYRPWIDDGNRIAWLGADSTSLKEDRVARFETLFRRRLTGAAEPDAVPASELGVSDRVVLIPGWVADAGVARIDVDDFRNGDPANDPASGAPGGDLAGLVAALPALDSLGVNTIVVSPLFAMEGDDPLAPIDLKTIDPRYGDEALFRRLVDRAHARRIRVVLEVPFHQVGLAHPWYQDAVEWREESAFWTFFAPAPGAVPEGAASGTPRRPRWNADNVQAVDEILAALLLWADTRIDGWYFHGVDTQPPAFWAALAASAKALDPRCWIVGDAVSPAGDWLTGDRLDAVVDPGFSAAVSDFALAERLDAVGFDRALGRIQVATPEPYNRTRFHAFDEDALSGGDEARRRLAVFLQMTLPGAPVLRSGDTSRWHRDLLALRREHPALRRGSWQPLLAEGGQYAVLRRSSEEILLVVVNRTDRPMSAKLPMPRGTGGTRERSVFDLLGGSRHALRGGDLLLKDLAPMSGAVIQVK